VLFPGRGALMYLTSAQLASGVEMRHELSELFGVPADLLALVFAGESPDPAEWSPAELARAVSALDEIEQTIVRACGEIDARLARRGYVLPVDVRQFPIVGTWVRSITRYLLHTQREGTQEATGRIERDARDAREFLQLVADGKVLLGANDPLATSAGGSVHLSGPGRHFSRQTLGAL